MSPARLGQARSQSSGTKQPGSPVSSASALERALARRMIRAVGSPPIRLALWDASEIALCAAAPWAKVIFRDRAAFWRVLLDPNFQFGEAYRDGRVEVEGDLVAMLEAVDRGRASSARRASLLPGALLRLLHRARCNTLAGARDNIHHHYDLGEAFYKLWLDRELVYSGAYFADPNMSLDDAQQAKLHYVCRKLRLRPGERVVEVGGGWGALARLMARDYGVTVRSFNISRPQLEYARRRAKEEGLAARVEFVEGDYRMISGRFDALVSLGMLEHVGRRFYRAFGQMMDRCLGPSGRGLIQTIGQDRPGETSPWIERRIFPGAYPPAPGELAALFEQAGFSLLDVENLRLHYARTLRCWLDRFEAARDRVEAMFDQRLTRMWRLYLAGSCAAFQSGGLQLFQILFARSGSNDVPWTREDLYS